MPTGKTRTSTQKKKGAMRAPHGPQPMPSRAPVAHLQKGGNRRRTRVQQVGRDDLRTQTVLHRAQKQRTALGLGETFELQPSTTSLEAGSLNRNVLEESP